jgi:hypothetical protein
MDKMRSSKLIESEENVRKAIVKEAKRIEEDTMFSSKEHFIVGHYFRIFNILLSGSSAVAAVVVGTSIMTRADPQGTLTGVLALYVAISSILVLFFKPHDNSLSHKSAGNEYKSIRNEARRLSEIDSISDVTNEELRKSLNILVEKQTRANQCYSLLPDWAHKMAKKRIDEGEATYKVDKS